MLIVVCLVAGLWLEKTLAPKVSCEGCEAKGGQPLGAAGGTGVGLGGGVVPERGEPHGYIQLATDVFSFLIQQLVCSSSGMVRLPSVNSTRSSWRPLTSFIFY